MSKVRVIAGGGCRLIPHLGLLGLAARALEMVAVVLLILALPARPVLLVNGVGSAHLPVCVPCVLWRKGLCVRQLSEWKSSEGWDGTHRQGVRARSPTPAPPIYHAPDDGDARHAAPRLVRKFGARRHGCRVRLLLLPAFFPCPCVSCAR